ncbi:hypothetical protein ACIOHC_36105 [Streptomyces sp. NPDC088252]|uniref:hypothetical protein n=1 Tax=Streptomyces sp. NPDC088252 TaxID=3365845 RepID=UPI0038129F45
MDIFGSYIGCTWVKPRTPLFHRFELNEIDGECRTSQATFVRIWPLRVALLFGRWQATGMTPGEMFAHVFTSREVAIHDEDGELDPRYVRAARERIAENAQDPDEEWEILRMMGLDS